jgi:anti-sigma factor ChrR (cupin superfamily)
VVVVKLELYLVGSLSWPEALAVAEHLEACADCFGWMARRRADTADGFAGPPSRGPVTGGPP